MALQNVSARIFFLQSAKWMDMVELNAICQLNAAEPCSHYKMQISWGR